MWYVDDRVRNIHLVIGQDRIKLKCSFRGIQAIEFAIFDCHRIGLDHFDVKDRVHGNERIEFVIFT